MIGKSYTVKTIDEAPTCPGIYQITCIATGMWYVGQAQNIRRRWQSHRKTGGNRAMRQDWATCGAEAFIFSVFKECPVSSLDVEEQRLIDTLPWHTTYNISPTAGSCRGCKRPESAIKATAAKMKGRKHTDEHRARLREAWKTRPPVSDETKQKLRDAHLRLPPRSEEWRRNLSLALTGKRASPETIEKLRASHTGKKQSDETKIKRAEKLTGKKRPLDAIRRTADAQRGRKLSDEQKQRLREINTGRKATEETRSKMSEAQKRRHAARRAAKEEARQSSAC